MIKKEEISALDAKFEAQKIAFAPFAFQVTRVLRDKGVLSYLRRQRQKGASILKMNIDLNISEYGLKVLLEMAYVSGIVNRTQDEVYSLTKVGYFLDSDELTRVNMDFTQDVCYKGLFHLEKAIDNGIPAGLKELGDWSTLYDGLAELETKVQKSWFNFDHYYSDNSFPEALPIIFESSPKTLLDVGGNTGKFSIECCKFNPDVNVTIIDLPAQIDLATRNIEKYSFSERISYLPLNMLRLDKLFPQTEAIWMSQFLDCFSKTEIVSILKHAVKTMVPETKLFIMETFWDNQKYRAASLSLAATSVYFTAIANGNSKMYGREEFLQLIIESGLEIIDEVYPVGISHSIITCQLSQF